MRYLYPIKLHCYICFHLLSKSPWKDTQKYADPATRLDKYRHHLLLALNWYPVPGKVEVGAGWAGPLAERVGGGGAAVPGRLLVVGLEKTRVFLKTQPSGFFVVFFVGFFGFFCFFFCFFLYICPEE
jgi:hypothetical protein